MFEHYEKMRRRMRDDNLIIAFLLIGVAVIIVVMGIVLSGCASPTETDRTGTRVHVAIINQWYPTSMVRVTENRGGPMLSYLEPQEVDTLLVLPGTQLCALPNTGTSYKSIIVPTIDTLWRIR